MNITLEIHDYAIHVLCDIKITDNYYSFALNQKLKIKNIYNNGKVVCIDSCEFLDVDFRPKMCKYQLIDLSPGTLNIEYERELSGWFLFMQKELFHFSFYNAWYPTMLSHEETYEIDLAYDNQYELIQGIYNPSLNTWHYTTQNQDFVDCNIMLINKKYAIKLNVDNAVIWYFENDQKDAAKTFCNTLKDVSNFYYQLYGYHKSGDLTIVLLPEKYKGMGAYQRTGLTVFAETIKSNDWITHSISHEIGHNYANGASCTSWEDWLNETHAEWNALLFELKHNPQLFDKLMQLKSNQYKGDYQIKPLGETRPEDVHETGTLIYYDIYQQLGEEAIITLLKTFDSLEIKDTAHYLEELSKKDNDLFLLLSSKLNIK